MIRRIAGRDPEALEIFYDRFSSAVFGIAMKILGSRADAEDVVADTFWEIWRKADRYDPSRGSVASYVLLLARSRAIDRKRRRHSHAATLNGSAAHAPNEVPETSHHAQSPENEILLDEQRHEIHRLLAEMRPEQREAVELNILKGLSHQQVARALDLPLGTIKTRIRQGLIHLQNRMRTLRRGDIR